MLRPEEQSKAIIFENKENIYICVKRSDYFKLKILARNTRRHLQFRIDNLFTKLKIVKKKKKLT